jgi:hypothetical protein
MPVPVVVTETQRKDVKEIKQDFDVKNIRIESVSKAIIETLNPTSAAGVSKVLNWVIKSSRLEGGKDKKNFSITQSQDWLKKPTSKLIMGGDLTEGFDYLRTNFLSNSTHKKLLEELTKFNSVNSEEEKENTQSSGLSSK